MEECSHEVWMNRKPEEKMASHHMHRDLINRKPEENHNQSKTIIDDLELVKVHSD
jgi:predicted nuclease of restriction endonuclease-like (RecB) superfamily